MSKIQNYYPMEHLKVSKDMVVQFEQAILSHLRSNQYEHLSEQLMKIKNIKFKYHKDSYDSEIESVSQKLSRFMAYQEALFNLTITGQIMPVRISNVYNNIGEHRITISYEEKQDSSTTSSGDTEISLPIYVHETFMLKPSLKN